MVWFFRAKWVPNEWPPRPRVAHLARPRAEGALNASGAALGSAESKTMKRAVERFTDTFSRDDAKQHLATECLNEISNVMPYLPCIKKL